MLHGAVEVTAAEQAALEAVTQEKTDTSALKRFGEWVLSTMQAGASKAMVPIVAAAVRHMIEEAGCIAGHL